MIPACLFHRVEKRGLHMLTDMENSCSGSFSIPSSYPTPILASTRHSFSSTGFHPLLVFVDIFAWEQLNSLPTNSSWDSALWVWRNAAPLWHGNLGENTAGPRVRWWQRIQCGLLQHACQGGREGAVPQVHEVSGGTWEVGWARAGTLMQLQISYCSKVDTWWDFKAFHAPVFWMSRSFESKIKSFEVTSTQSSGPDSQEV